MNLIKLNDHCFKKIESVETFSLLIAQLLESDVHRYDLLLDLSWWCVKEDRISPVINRAIATYDRTYEMVQCLSRRIMKKKNSQQSLLEVDASDLDDAARNRIWEVNSTIFYYGEDVHYNEELLWKFLNNWRYGDKSFDLKAELKRHYCRPLARRFALEYGKTVVQQDQLWMLAPHYYDMFSGFQWVPEGIYDDLVSRKLMKSCTLFRAFMMTFSTESSYFDCITAYRQFADRMEFIYRTNNPMPPLPPMRDFKEIPRIVNAIVLGQSPAELEEALGTAPAVFARDEILFRYVIWRRGQDDDFLDWIKALYNRIDMQTFCITDSIDFSHCKIENMLALVKYLKNELNMSFACIISSIHYFDSDVIFERCIKSGELFGKFASLLFFCHSRHEELMAELGRFVYRCDSVAAARRLLSLLSTLDKHRTPPTPSMKLYGIPSLARQVNSITQLFKNTTTLRIHTHGPLLLMLRSAYKDAFDQNCSQEWKDALKVYLQEAQME